MEEIMEPIELFAAGVLTVCALHLATVVGTRLESWWQKTTGKKKTADTTVRQRSDWYAFFHCADLVGREPKAKNVASGVGNTTGLPGRTKAPTGRRAPTRLRVP